VVSGGGYTDEEAQDAVGTILTDTTEIDLTYSDATPSITADIKTGSVVSTKLATAVQTSLGKADSATQPADIANFETTTELNARDTANRSRANHTGTQTASTISDFDTEVANNSAVTANTAKVSYTDAAKVATIETNADVTDTTNVTAAGALMDSEVTNLAQVKAFDTTDYVTPTGTETLTNKTLTDTKIETSINAQTGTTYTLVLADASKHVSMSNASANTLTVPPNSSVAFPTGTRLMVEQKGAGSTTIAAGAGVTINAPASVALEIGEQYSSRGLLKTATDTWLLI